MKADSAPQSGTGAVWPTWLLGAVALLAALLVLVLVTGRQLSELRTAAMVRDDQVATLVHEAEIAYWRLRQAWSDVAEGTDQRAELETLRNRFLAWTGQLRALREPPVAPLLADLPGARTTLGNLETLRAQIEPILVPTPSSGPLVTTTAQSLWPAVAGMGAPLADLSAALSQRIAERATERSNAAQRQHQLGWALLLGLVVLIGGFAVVLGHQLRRLRERRVALEVLTRRLGEARSEAEAASQAKSIFLANMSHEIRTPFHGLMGMLSLLRESGLNPRQIDHLRTATESADHLLAILNDILDVSQLESGRMSLHPTPVELRALLREVEALMRPQAMGRRLALHIDADPAVPEWIVADGKRVKQVLFNLVSNAIKFSDRGAVVLDARVRPDANGRQDLEFVVTDTGIGMDEATVGSLFQRFRQGDRTLSRRHGGSGLGLEISRSLARLMGGDVGVRSRLGEGSVFTFRLPVSPLPAAPEVAADPDVGHPAGATVRRLRVLVAEDHTVNRQYMAALLERLGHEGHFAVNGEEALRAAREQQFDLVLMDLHMPVLDGVAATRAIRALPDPARSTVPILALTADAYPESRERSLLAGMNDFLSKPVSPDKLATALRQLFGAALRVSTTQAAAPADEVAPADAPALGRPGRGASTLPLLDESTIAQALQAMPRERLLRLMNDFLAQGPSAVERLRAAVRDAQPLELRVNAHAVKGAALNLGLAALAHTAESLQEGAAHLPAHEIALLVQRFEDQLSATRSALMAARLLPDPASA